ncbi:hypothetical protein [Streptomyces sp. NPDC051738]|uniref:hypothetical protein n=1 Tax=Streptomyces sp. NPDC051738 TaxID=3365672 RepID=UPI0037D01F1C
MSVRNVIRTSAVASVALAASLAFIPQASADTAVIPFIRHAQSTLYLDASISQGIRLNDCNDGEYQRWS